MNGSVSAIIPTYNGAAWVGEALASVVAQSRMPLELIVVDDASTDDTLAIVERETAKAPFPVAIERLARNSGGPALPLNVALGRIRGDYVAVLDQDDVWLSDKLRLECGLLDEYPDCGFAFGLSADLNAPEVMLQQASLLTDLNPDRLPERSARKLPGRLALRHLLERGNYVLGFPGFTFRRACIADRKQLDAALRIGADYDLLCWLCLQGPVAFDPRLHYLRRYHARNMSGAERAMLRDLNAVRKRYLALAPELVEEIGPGSPLWRDLEGRWRWPAPREWAGRFGQAGRRWAENWLPSGAYGALKRAYRGWRPRHD